MTLCFVLTFISVLFSYPVTYLKHNAIETPNQYTDSMKQEPNLIGLLERSEIFRRTGA